ncbi:hypothetical protein KPATCC21470_0781 [Kitasatospora purpeofusca]
MEVGSRHGRLGRLLPGSVPGHCRTHATCPAVAVSPSRLLERVAPAATPTTGLRRVRLRPPPLVIRQIAPPRDRNYAPTA